MIEWLGNTLVGVDRIGTLCLRLGGFIGSIQVKRFVPIGLFRLVRDGRGKIDEIRF